MQHYIVEVIFHSDRIIKVVGKGDRGEKGKSKDVDVGFVGPGGGSEDELRSPSPRTGGLDDLELNYDDLEGSRSSKRIQFAQ